MHFTNNQSPQYVFSKRDPGIGPGIIDMMIQRKMKKHAHIYIVFLMVVFYTACGQNQTTPPHENLNRHRSGVPESQLKEAAASPVPMSMVRNVRQAKNGDILIASYIGVYRFDGNRLPI
jgi:hypothetical protein